MIRGRAGARGSRSAEFAHNDLARLAGLYKDAAESRAGGRSFLKKSLRSWIRSAANLLASALPWSVKNRPAIAGEVAAIDQKLAETVEAIPRRRPIIQSACRLKRRRELPPQSQQAF